MKDSETLLYRCLEIAQHDLLSRDEYLRGTEDFWGKQTALCHDRLTVMSEIFYTSKEKPKTFKKL